MRAIEDRLAEAGLPPLPRTAWAEIDLDALRDNLATLRRLAGDGVPVHPVVKADAYGHGAIPVARALAAAGADGFCVAALDEALAIRRAGLEPPILVLYPIPQALVPTARREAVAVTVGDRELLEALLATVGTDPGEPALAVHLEVETGLGRGGFLDDAAVAAARALSAAPGIRVAGIWTHLQAPEDADRSAAQLRAFERTVSAILAAGVPIPRRHLAATGGLLLGDAVGLEGVRPGLAVYGLVPDELLGDAPRTPIPGAGALRPALSLRARPVRVADLPAGTGISYGPTFTTSRPSRIATLPLGYGDGWPRSLSNRASVLVRGERVPLVGNVAMDAVMADVTDVPGEPITVRDEFVLIGRQGASEITAADVAAARGTNSWEVVTGLAGRLPRVYHSASVPRELRTLVDDEAGSRRSMRP